jgi:hypothetical protein
MVRAKFRVTKITHVEWSKTVRVIELTAVYDDGIDENRRFARATPSGTLNMTVDNPAAAEQFQMGKVFYLDFTPAE